MSKKPKFEDTTKRATSKHIVPKRQLSKWEKESRRRRIIGIIVSIVIVGVVISGGIVAYVELVMPWHQTVVAVNGTGYDMDYFVKMFRVQRAAFEFKYGYDLSQYSAEQQCQYVVGIIQRNELVRQKAEELSKDIDVDIIDITDDDINAEIQNYFYYDPEGDITPEDFNNLVNNWLESRNVSRDSFEELEITPVILSKKLQEAMGKTEYPVDKTYTHVKVQAVLVGTEEGAKEVKGKWGDFNQIVKDYSPAKYYPEDGYWLVMVYEPEEEEEQEEEGRYILAMLLATQEKTDEIAAKIEAGDDFAELAINNSLDNSAADGGDLGWMSLDDIELKFGNLDTIQNLDQNTLSEPIPQNYPDESVEWLPRYIEESSVFEDYVFSDNVEGVISNPIHDTTYTTKGGYWLVMVYEPDEPEEEDEEEDGLYIQAILLDSKEEAEELRAEIEAGSDFAEVAKEHSLDSSASSGGDIGWLSLNDIESQFGEDNLATIQLLEMDTLSEPIYYEDTSKKSGFWVIEVLDREDRTLIDKHRDSYISDYYSEWFDVAMETGKEEGRIKDYLNGEKISWAVDHI